jgi:hypothetical protein
MNGADDISAGIAQRAGTQRMFALGLSQMVAGPYDVAAGTTVGLTIKLPVDTVQGGISLLTTNPATTLRGLYSTITTPSQYYSGLRNCTNLYNCSVEGSSAVAGTGLALEGGVGAVRFGGRLVNGVDNLLAPTVPQPFTLHFRAGVTDGEAGFSAPQAGLTFEQLQGASRGGVDPSYVAPNGRLLYPSPLTGQLPNGFAVPPVIVTLQRGTLLDRLGDPNGRFLAPAGTPFEQRALPGSSTAEPYYQYRVLRPLPVDAGPAAPGFNQVGGGTQYQVRNGLTIQQLLEQNYIRCVRGPGC